MIKNLVGDNIFMIVWMVSVSYTVIQSFTYQPNSLQKITMKLICQIMSNSCLI